MLMSMPMSMSTVMSMYVFSIAKRRNRIEFWHRFLYAINSKNSIRFNTKNAIDTVLGFNQVILLHLLIHLLPQQLPSL